MNKFDKLINILQVYTLKEIFIKLDILFFVVKDFLFDSFPLIINFIIIIAPNFYSLVKIAGLNIDIIQASMGWVIACHYVFFFIPMTANTEVLGINVSKNFISNKPILTSRNLYQSLITQSLITIFGSTLFYFSEKVLFKIGFEEELCYFTGLTLLRLIPMIILQGYNENLRNFLISCRIFQQFYISNLISTIIYILIYEVYFSYYELALDSFIIAKTIQEVFNLFIFIYFFKKYIPNNNYYKFKSFNEVFTEFGEFFNIFYKICIGLYATMMTVQINTYYIGLTKNIIDATSWFCMTNIGEITFSVGVGFGSISRTNVNSLKGINKFNLSIKLSKIYMIISLFFGMIWGWFILIFRNHLAYFFTTENVAPLLSKVLIIYAFISVIDMNLFLFGGVLRNYDLSSEFFRGNLIFCVFITIFVGYYLCIELELGVIGSCLSFLLSYILLINYFIFVFLTKVKEIKEFDDKSILKEEILMNNDKLNN